MLTIIGFLPLFFLPIIESFNRSLGFDLLLIGSVLLSFSVLRKKKIYSDWIDNLWLMLLTIFAVSIIFSWSPGRSYVEFLRYLAYFLLFISLRNLGDKEIIFKKLYILSIIINTFILSMLALIFMVISMDQLPIRISDMNLFLLDSGHNSLADILIFAIPLVILSAGTKKGNYQKLFFVLSVIFVIMMFFSFSRTGLLILAFLFFFFIVKYKQEAIFAKWVILICGLTFILLVSSFIYSNFILSEKDLGEAIQGLYKPVVKEQRLNFILQSLSAFSTSPLFGTGLDTFRYASKLYQNQPASWSLYVHNHYIEILQETGIFGGILFAILIFFCLYKVYFSFNKNKQDASFIYDSGLILGIFASALHSFIDFDWHFLSIFMYFWIGIALLLPKTKEYFYGKQIYLYLPAIAVILFLGKFLLQLDSDLAFYKANIYIQNGKRREAIDFLIKSFRIDPKNDAFAREIAVESEEINNYEQAHFWYQKAILLNPLDSELYIKKDYALYLKQAKEALQKGDRLKSYNFILKVFKIYPYFNNSSDNKNNISQTFLPMKKYDNKETINYLSQFMNDLLLASKKKNLTISEIKLIFNILKKNYD